MQRGRRFATLATVIAALLAASTTAVHAADHGSSQAALSALARTVPTGRDEKAIRYVENANGQLDEWTARLVARLARGDGPRPSDPLFDGRAELQVRKIEVTYAGYTANPALAHAFRTLASLHRARLDALRAMADSGPDAELFTRHHDAVRQLARGIRTWRTIR